MQSAVIAAHDTSSSAHIQTTAELVEAGPLDRLKTRPSLASFRPKTGRWSLQRPGGNTEIAVKHDIEQGC